MGRGGGGPTQPQVFKFKGNWGEGVVGIYVLSDKIFFSSKLKDLQLGPARKYSDSFRLSASKHSQYNIVSRRLG